MSGSEASGEARDLPALLWLATAAAAEALDADHAVLRLRDVARRRYTIRSSFGAPAGRDRHALFRLDRRLASEAVRCGRPVLVRSLADDPALRAYASRVRSALALPLAHGGRPLGTLALFAAASGSRRGAFRDADLARALRLAAHVERALAVGPARAPDALLDADGLCARLARETGRVAGSGGRVTLCTCRVDNPRELAAGGPGGAEAAAARSARALRAELPPDGALARLGPEEFAAILPEPGGSASERVLTFARAVATAVAKAETGGDAVPVALAFGYAVFPDEVRDPDALLARAREPRIRTV